MKKVSLITLTKNSDETLVNCLNSALNQNYENLEFIFVDANSKDNTLKIINSFPKKKKIIQQKSNGLYNALNEGIKACSGEVIGILHSDDVLNSKNTITKIIKKINQSNSKIFFGDVVYFKGNPNEINRYYSVTNFKINDMKYGLMPPHTGSFIRKEIFKKYRYNNELKIAGDFEFFFRVLFKDKIPFERLGFITTRMKTGGISTANLNSYFTITNELAKCYKKHKIKFGYLRSLIRTPLKLEQLFFKKNKFTKFYNLKSDFFEKNSQFNFKLIKNFKNLNKHKNYILSALNLAFLGFFSQKKIINNQNYLLWPDGIFSSLVISKNIKKNPGRNFFLQFKLPKKIKKIFVLGNLSKYSKKFLSSKYRAKIVNVNLPYGSAEQIIKFLKKIKFKVDRTSIIFITLPTPKQEQVAEYLASTNNKFKIICIGASIAIASGEEKKVPDILSFLEFVWRLRYETKRRIFRLISTYIYYIKDKFTLKRVNQIKIKIVK